jgi:mRNA-degrading endonuclease RelE of RelBE toxin-antitoxin system
VKEVVSHEDWQARRIRVGDYRIIFEIHDQVLLIIVVDIGHARGSRPAWRARWTTDRSGK